MKTFILSNILLLSLSSFAQNDLDLKISLNSIESIELTNGQVLNAQTDDLDSLFATNNESLLITQNSGIKKVELHNGGTILLNSAAEKAVGPLTQGGDMGGGGK